MFLGAGIVLLIVWVLGFLVFKKVVGGVIHIVLIIAVIALALHFLGRG
jgi:hypothetical protein